MTLIPASNDVGITLVTVGGIVGALAIFFVGLRVWARRIQKTALDASDYTIFAALV